MTSLTRYLRILGVTRREPSLEALTKLTRAHLTGVPFENVSKLYRYRRSGLRWIPDVSEYLDDIERNHLGGTCYTNNYFLYLLLDSLGYDVALCGADMSNPDVHLRGPKIQPTAAVPDTVAATSSAVSSDPRNTTSPGRSSN